MHDLREQLEIDLEDLFRDENTKDDTVEKLHRYSHISLFYNGNRVIINMNNVMFIDNKQNYIEFVFNNLARIIVFKDKVVFQNPDYGIPYETLVEMSSQSETQSQSQTREVDRREL